MSIQTQYETEQNELYKQEMLSEETVSLLNDHLEELKSESARNHYRKAVSDITHYCGKDFLCLTKADVQKYFDSIKDFMTFNTQRKSLSIYRALARRADSLYDRGLIASFTGVTKAEQQSVKLESLPVKKEVEKVREYLAKTSSWPIRKRKTVVAAMSLAMENGLSTEEIISLKYGNVHYQKDGYCFLRLDSDDIIVRERILPLRKPTAELIEQVGAMNANPATGEQIFRNSTGAPLSERSLQMYLHDACSEAGAENFDLNGLRNVGIIFMLSANVPIDDLAVELNVTNRWFSRYEISVSRLRNAAASKNPIALKVLEWQEQ